MKKMTKITITLDLYVPDDSDLNEANEALAGDLGSFLSDLQMGGGQTGDLPEWRVQVKESFVPGRGIWFSQQGIEDEEIWND